MDQNKHRKDGSLKSVSYAKWGYIFITPFFLVYIVFTLVPQFLTVYNSFFETYRVGLTQVGPNFVGLDNYKELFTPNSTGTILVLKYAANTMIMWFVGALPQFAVALLLAIFFTSYRLNIKGQAFFKTVIYMPNLIMASAFAMLFFTLFSDFGPINSMLSKIGIIKEPIKFMSSVGGTRGLVAFMNFLMWFGNTTILLLAGMLGIDTSLYEAAEVDGATSSQVFFRITLPILRPILIYVLITSLIGGLQMFDVPQILTSGAGGPIVNGKKTSQTLIMLLNDHLFSKNYGMAGALSVILFIITSLLSFLVFKMTKSNDEYK